MKLNAVVKTCLVGSLFLSGYAIASDLEVSASLGKTEFDFANSNETVDFTELNITGLYLIPSPSLELGVGLALQHSKADEQGETTELDDLMLVGRAAKDFNGVKPYVKLEFVLLSSGTVSGNSFEYDLENSGYELAIGSMFSITPTIDLAIETALTAEKELDGEFGGFDIGKVEYEYGIFDSFSIGVNLSI